MQAAETSNKQLNRAGYKASTCLWGYGVRGVDGLLTHQMDERKMWVRESELNLSQLLSAYK